jgi:hypothetical protein
VEFKTKGHMGSISPVSSLASIASLDSAKSKKDDKSEKSVAEFTANSDAVILDASLGTKSAEVNQKKSGDNFQQLYEALSLTGREIVDKINEQLKLTLPEGVQSLKPEDVTPDATADRIVKGVTAFFEIYAKQKKNLSGDELVDSFISEVQRGVSSGYDDAFKFLEGIGAFKVDGVQDGVEKTRSLIDEKLAAFAAQKKKDLSPVAESEAKAVSTPTESIDVQA